MNDEIMVSISCLAFNHEKYIRQCLDGFIMQKTNFKFEVLVHDDASTDGTADIIREYEEKYPDIIKPIYQTENQYSQGVNIGKIFQKPRAKGKYYATCEGDDFWCDPNKLQIQVDALQSHPDCEMCVHVVEDVDESGLSKKKFHPNFQLDEGVIDMDKYIDIMCSKSFHPFQTSSYLYKQSALTIDPIPEFVKYFDVGDVKIMLTVIANTNIYFINEIMSCYRVNSKGSWTQRVFLNQNRRLQHEKNMIKALLSYDDYTDNKYSSQIFKLINEKKFYIDLWEGRYKKCLLKENREFFNNLQKKEKIFIILNVFFPHIMKMYKKRKGN